MQTPITNSIICGDCRDKMRQYIPADFVDLIYLDPPFFSGKNYDLIWKKRDSKDTVSHPAFGDTTSTFDDALKKRFGVDYSECEATVECFEGAGLYKKVCGICGRDWGVKPNGDPDELCGYPKCEGTLSETKGVRKNDVEIYVGWLKERLEECYRVLKPTGSIYVHLDWHAVHYVKVAMDEIFGMDNFRNEIAWCYRKWSVAQKQFVRNHDTILFYSKSDDNVFNTMYVPVSEGTQKRWKGKRIKSVIGSDGKRTTSSEIIKSKGSPMPDWWDISVINSNANERMGYPTQKPEALLERIIKASSKPGDLIIDPFCGCGTATKVAQDQGRDWIGIDIEPIACAVMQLRMLRSCGIDVPVHGYPEAPAEPVDVTDLSGLEFQHWVVELIDGRQPRRSNETFDGFIANPQITGLKEGDPIEVKKFDKVGTKYIKQFAFDLMHGGKKAGLFVALGFAKTTEIEVEGIRRHDGITIHLMTLTEILAMNVGKKIVKPPNKHQKGAQAKLQ